MTILAIDTSCDETSAAVTQDRAILSNVISSQVRYHKRFGGVVPFLAQRLHRERIDAIIRLALERAGLGLGDIEAIAVTQGPGLAPALEVGVAKAKELAQKNGLPLYAINHMAGHIAACFAGKGEVAYPALVLLVSGKHSELVYVERFGAFQLLGQTLDDALGEAYDKVARMLGLDYPGGRTVSRLALQGDSNRYPLPVPMQYSKDLNFSYSGLKNAVRLLVDEVRGGPEGALSQGQIADIAASFERVAQEAVLLKVQRALKERPHVRSLLLGGGVAANVPLRRRLRAVAKEAGIPLFTPPNLKLCTDNAAMIGLAASLGIEEGQTPVEPDGLERTPRLPL